MSAGRHSRYSYGRKHDSRHYPCVETRPPHPKAVIRHGIHPSHETSRTRKVDKRGELSAAVRRIFSPRWTETRISEGVVKIVKLAPRERFQLFIRYDDGAAGVLDLSALAGRGVFASWLEPGAYEKVRLSERGAPEWPGDIDLCPDALYLELTRKAPEDVFPALRTTPTHG